MRIEEKVIEVSPEIGKQILDLISKNEKPAAEKDGLGLSDLLSGLMQSIKEKEDSDDRTPQQKIDVLNEFLTSFRRTNPFKVGDFVTPIEGAERGQVFAVVHVGRHERAMTARFLDEHPVPPDMIVVHLEGAGTGLCFHDAHHDRFEHYTLALQEEFSKEQKAA